MSIWSTFEGYRDPTEAEVLEILKVSPVIVDTNVLLELYTLEGPARVLALDVLEALKDQLFVPHQVMREFWRNRHGVIAAIPRPARPLDGVQQSIFAVINSLRPDRERPEDIMEIRQAIESQLAELTNLIDSARGEPLNVAQLLTDTSLDPVLGRLERILNERVGDSFGANESAKVAEGLERFAKKIPPGYEDAKDKAEQVPEHGTGDFLMWEQALDYISSDTTSENFVFVTDDVKEDWRVVVKQPERQVLGARPELIAEAMDRTNARAIFLKQSDFYRLMAKLRSDDESTSASLVTATTISAESGDELQAGWTVSTYQQLLSGLRIGGNEIQANVIVHAAASGGFVRRADIYDKAGYSVNRSLRRFSLPAQRLTLSFIDEGMLREDVEQPLEAMYEGPGKTTGYRVPTQFDNFEKETREASSD